MDRFQELLAAIKAYDNEIGGGKATAHHSAVSVRVAAMRAALSPDSAEPGVPREPSKHDEVRAKQDA